MADAMSEKKISILAVEDDRDLLELTGAILGQDSHVECTTEPVAALRAMFEKRFDLLVTDLSITHAGDGLILAGAMRHLHPTARTVLITGYPDFTRALTAIQGTLDKVLLKPVEIEDIRKLPHLSHPVARTALEPGQKTLWTLIEEKRTDLLKEWLALVEQDPEIARLQLAPSERLDHMEEILGELAGHGAGPRPSPDKRRKAAEHGRERRQLNYRPEWVAKELSYLRRVINMAVLRELLHLDLSRLAGDVFAMNAAIDADLLQSLRSFGLLSEAEPEG